MAGIYIHIPFCKQACSYCDFHFSTKLSGKQNFIDALLKEIELRASYLENEKVETIYFGGGTPSLLSQEELDLIVDQLQKNFFIDSTAEITLEANPDDLSRLKLKELASSPINRLSIGIQSFFEKDLRFMNRAHSATEALNSIQDAQNIGFENLNIDLIFGGPTTSDGMWEKNLEQFVKLKIPHLSAYSLTVEEKTALAHQIEKGRVSPIDDSKNYRHYLALQEVIQANGYEQYELSNYCNNEQYSRHNTAYWFGKKYLGLGPSAHSFDGNSRQWNVNNNIAYVKAIKSGAPFFEKEILSEIDQYHEYLITSLRTKWGVQYVDISTKFSKSIQTHFLQQVKKLNDDHIELYDNQLLVKKEFLFQSDEIVRNLML